jgi:hypothetical protein
MFSPFGRRPVSYGLTSTLEGGILPPPSGFGYLKEVLASIGLNRLSTGDKMTKCEL